MRIAAAYSACKYDVCTSDVRGVTAHTCPRRPSWYESMPSFFVKSHFTFYLYKNPLRTWTKVWPHNRGADQEEKKTVANELKQINRENQTTPGTHFKEV